MVAPGSGARHGGADVSDREHNRKHMPDVSRFFAQVNEVFPGCKLEYAEQRTPEGAWKVGMERLDSGEKINHGRRARFYPSRGGEDESRNA